MGFLYVLTRIFVYPFLFLHYKRRTVYENKQIQKRKTKGAVILAANHNSIHDYVFLSISMKRKLHYVTSEKVSFFQKVLGAVFVSEEEKENKILSLLKEGKAVLIFPEREYFGKNMAPFDSLVTRVAITSGVPILPVYVNGRYGVFKRGHLAVGVMMNATEEKASVLELRKKIKNLINADHDRDSYLNYGRGFSPRKILMDFAIIHIYLSNLYFRVRKNKEKTKIKGGAVVVANHVSMLDPVLMTIVFKGRRVYALTAETLFDGHPVRSFFLRQCGCVRVDRKTADLSSLQAATDIVKAGSLLVVFPTGHIDVNSDMSDIKAGAAMIAANAGVPLIPAFIRKPEGKRNYQFTVGDAINPKDYMKGPVARGAELARITEVVKESILALNPDK